MDFAMFIASVAIAAIIAIFTVIFVLGRKNKLSDYEPISEDEMLLISIVDEKFWTQMLDYTRTMRMSPGLMDYIKDKKEVLEAINYFVLLQSAKKEKELKENWQNGENGNLQKQEITHNEKMILQRLSRWK